MMKRINKLIQYYFYQLFNSYVFISLNILSLIGSIITIVLCYFLNNTILDSSSFIISIVYQVLLLVILLYLCIKLFNENKYNLSDIKLLGKNFYKNQLFWTKFLVILISSSILIFIMSILATITMIILQIDTYTILGIFGSNFAGLFINILVFVPILILLSILLSRIWSPMVSLLIISVAPLTSCIGNFLLSNSNNCNDINKNINDMNAKVQYGKIYQFDNNNQMIDYVYAYNYNYNQLANINMNLDISNSINYVNYYNFLMPGNITLATQQAIYSLINSEINVSNYLNYSGSLSKIVPYKYENLSSYINENNSYILTNMDDQNFFALNESQLTEILMQSLVKLKDKHASIINNPKEIAVIYNALNTANNQLWNIENFNKKQLQFLFDLLGNTDSNLFYVWYYKNYLLGNLGNIIGLIANKYSQDLANLVNYLWFSQAAYFNLILVGDTPSTALNDFKNELRLKYPINNIYKSQMHASQSDIKFFSNNLVKINQQQVFILSNQGIYEPCDLIRFKNVFNLHTLNTQTDWINYLTIKNIPTVGFLQNVYHKLSGLFNPTNANDKIISINLANTGFDLKSFNQIFLLKKTPYNSTWISSIIIELAIIILFMTLAYHVNKKVKLG